LLNNYVILLAYLYKTSLGSRRRLGIRENTVGLESSQGHLKVKRVGRRVFNACERGVVGELNAADAEVVTSDHRRPVTVVLDLDLVLVTGQVQEFK